MTILIVEDDTYISNLLSELLKDKYKTIKAYSGTEALLQLKNNKIDLVLLDLMLPGLSGEDILPQICRQAKVIILSAKNTKDDKIINLLNGANDYITKPFDNEELLARIEVQLRTPLNHEDMMTIGHIRVDNKNRSVFVNGDEIRLTKLEYDILYFLMKNQNQVFSKSHIFEKVWNYDSIGNEESVKVHISNLRNKIGEYSTKKYIETVWGIGFRFVNK